MLTKPEEIERVDAAFTKLFRRYERALKQNGFVDPKKGHAAADWQAFAKTLPDDFYDQVRKAEKAVTLRNEPPRTNRRDGTATRWRDTDVARDTPMLFSAVTTVRNNFFHGDKFTGDRSNDSRDLILVSEALWVLEFALPHNPKVKAAVDADA